MLATQRPRLAAAFSVLLLAACGSEPEPAQRRPEPSPVTPAELVASFAWDVVGVRDRLVRWDGRALELVP